MGILSRDGTVHRLRAREVLGRHPTSTIVLDARQASAVHAVIAWSGDRWIVRDLGSTNGTYLNHQRLASGRDRTLEIGDVLTFGDPTDRWIVTALDAPTLRATSTHGERFAADGLLALPDDEHPEVVFVEASPGRWTRDGGEPLSGASIVDVHGTTWTVEAPDVLDTTGGRTGGGWSPDALEATFRVSSDEERVEVIIRHGLDEVVIAPRAHTYLLLVLARTRLTDRAAGLASEQEGWRTVDDLCRDLRATRGQIDLHIHRARRHVPRLLAVAAGGLVERRQGTGMVRLGVTHVRVERTDRSDPTWS